MSQAGLRQASVRAVTGTTGSYDGDWHALFTVRGVAAGAFEGRMISYVNGLLTQTNTNVNQAMQALADANGATNFSSLGTFTA